MVSPQPLHLSLDGQLVVSHVHADASFLATITDDGASFSGHDAANRSASMGHRNGVSTSPLYDSLNGLARLRGSKGAPSITHVSYSYDPWGNIEAETRPELNGVEYAFTGRERDRETGLYYYRARYYDPKLGRFISEDPIGLGGGINFYAYVLNAPINSSDPSGLSAEGPCDKACEQAKAMGLDNGDGGGVICCGGVKFGCVWGPPGQSGGTGPGANVSRRCVIQHETAHFPGTEDCPCDGSISRPWPRIGSSNSQRECTAFKATLQCLISGRSECGGNQHCDC